MNVSCRFSSCPWFGTDNEIFDHVETYHKKFLREPKGNVYYDFNFDDLQQQAFVLCSNNGLYWLRRRLHALCGDGIEFGVFHIGQSEQVKYELKLGLKRDGHCEYWGPYTSEQDNMHDSNKPELYNLRFDYGSLKLLNKTMPSRRLRLYFGPYDDSDDKICPSPHNMIWNEEDERLNGLCVDYFTCIVCFEYIQRDARFCENKHCVCLHCFVKMEKSGKLKCPTCRGQYLYDCIDLNIERLLRMIKWPDVPKP